MMYLKTIDGSPFASRLWFDAHTSDRPTLPCGTLKLLILHCLTNLCMTLPCTGAEQVSELQPMLSTDRLADTRHHCQD